MIESRELMTLRRIASKANPRIKEWAGLSDKGVRHALGLTLAEGSKLVAEALARGERGLLKPRAFIVSDSGAARPEAAGLLRRAIDLGLERFNLADDCFAKISTLKGAEGIALTLGFDAGAPDLGTLFSAPDAKWLIAAGVQDPGNAGALARTALAAGATGCLFLDGADPFSPKFLRGGMGASFALPCLTLTCGQFAASWNSGKARLVVATADEGAEDFRAVDYAAPLAILVGGERGIPETLLRLPATKARIPLRGGVESLNLAVAAGVVLFEAARHWHET